MAEKLMMPQEQNMVARDAMNKSEHGLLRALLLTFGVIGVIGIVWYFTTLSTLTIVCGVTSCIAAFVLGLSSLQPTKKSIINRSILIIFAMAGVVASVVRIVYDSNMLRDLWGALPHVLSLILFGVVLNVIIKSKIAGSE